MLNMVVIWSVHIRKIKNTPAEKKIAFECVCELDKESSLNIFHLVKSGAMRTEGISMKHRDVIAIVRIACYSLNQEKLFLSHENENEREKKIK